MKLSCFLPLLFPLLLSASPTSDPQYQLLPSLREQAAIQDSWHTERIAKIPDLLQKYGVDAWLMSEKEYAEDTVFWSLKAATQFSARRRTITLFIQTPKSSSEPSEYSWIDNKPQVWDDLVSVLEKHRPERIAINVDQQIAFSSGLHAGELRNLEENLGEWKDKFVSVPMLAVEYIGTMPDSQLSWYRKLQETAWAIISTAFSASVITPGHTTTEDVEWWMREQIQALNYTTWFQPDVNILGPDSVFEALIPNVNGTIQHGDVLHVDFGVTALGLNTDTQHLGYVLFPGETEHDVPAGLKEGLKTANRVQDIVRANMIVGRSGNTILENCKTQMYKEGISGRVYCHPIGDWGHSAGTLIGMFNLQDSVPVLGDLPLLDQTYYSIELYADHFVPERNFTMHFYAEEDVYWTENGWEWVFGRQERFHLIKPVSKDEALDQKILEM